MVVWWLPQRNRPPRHDLPVLGQASPTEVAMADMPVVEGRNRCGHYEIDKRPSYLQVKPYALHARNTRQSGLTEQLRNYMEPGD